VIPNAISVSDFVNAKVSAQSIGSIASNQIQGLVAQTAASVNQAATAITNVKGLGKFGLDAAQLQLSGLIKPGIADQIKLVPVGGINIDNCLDYMKAGASGLGIGSQLFDTQKIRDKNWKDLSNTLELFANKMKGFTEKRMI
jgi:hypothetical protein